MRPVAHPVSCHHSSPCSLHAVKRTLQPFAALPVGRRRPLPPLPPAPLPRRSLGPGLAVRAVSDTPPDVSDLLRKYGGSDGEAGWLGAIAVGPRDQRINPRFACRLPACLHMAHWPLRCLGLTLQLPSSKCPSRSGQASPTAAWATGAAWVGACEGKGAAGCMRRLIVQLRSRAGWATVHCGT